MWGGTRLVHLGTRDDPNVNVYECQECHTKQLDIIRDNDYENGFMNGKPELSDDEIARRIEDCREDDERRAGMVANWCKGKNVLDFGCGFGGFLNNIAHTANSVAGVELGLAEREYLCAKGLNVRKSIGEFGEQFDVITLFHVFEHLREPRKYLRSITAGLKAGGTLFVEVPNANDALLSLYDCDRFADFTYWSAHLYLYTRESLARIIEENDDLEIEQAGQFQRYPLSNHLYWLANGKPGGQKIWGFLNVDRMEREYAKVLESKEMCDTLFFRIKKR